MNNKKLLVIPALLLVLIMTFALCSCGSDNSADKEAESEKSTVVSSENEKTETEDPTDLIDLEALTEIESRDTSKVKIIKKEVERDVVSGFTMQGGDGLYLTVENSGYADVTELTIYVVGYTDKNGLTSVQPSLSLAINTVKYVQAFNSTEKTIKAGSSERIGVEVDADKFSNVRAIIAAYKTADGKEYKNSIAEEWVSSVQLGKKQTLD